jgi:hypothetical protein
MLRLLRVSSSDGLKLLPPYASIRDEKVFYLINYRFVKLVERVNRLVMRGCDSYCNQSIIAFRFPVFRLFSFNHTDQSRRDKATGKGFLIQEHEHINGVTVFSQCGWDIAKIEGKNASGR